MTVSPTIRWIAIIAVLLLIVTFSTVFGMLLVGYFALVALYYCAWALSDAVKAMWRK